MFKFKSPWSWLRNVANLQDPKIRQAPPQTSFTSNTWKDANVESVVNQGITQDLPAEVIELMKDALKFILFKIRPTKKV
jgi:hypothetical protein